MQDKVNFPEVLASLIKHRLNFFVPRDVTRKHESFRTQGGCEFPHVVFEPFTLIREGELCSSLVPCLSNVPGDAAFVSDSEDDAYFVFKHKCSCLNSRQRVSRGPGGRQARVV